MLEKKEVPMYQRWICGSMLTAGIGLFGVVAWVQSDRQAFTSARGSSGSEAIQMVISPLSPEEVAAPEDEPVLELPQDQIFGRRRAPAAAPPAVPEQAPSPCSPWEEIGPKNVDDGVPSGIRRVRKLC